MIALVTKNIYALQKRAEGNADMHLACNIMQTKQCSISTRTEDKIVRAVDRVERSKVLMIIS